MSRKEDLPLLIEYFLEKFRNQFQKGIQFLSTNALLVLHNYDWPGNIRELENVLERAFVICNSDTIKIDSLPERLWRDKTDKQSIQTSNRNMSLKEAERIVIKNILDKNSGHRGKAAKELNMDRSTLWRKIKKYNL